MNKPTIDYRLGAGRSFWRKELLSFGPWRAKPFQRNALLRLIAVAAEERTPLSPLLVAWSYDQRGRQAHRLRLLANALEQGVALPDALERFPGLLSDEQCLLVRYGAESGSLAPMIRGRLEADRDQPSSVTMQLRNAGMYLGIFCYAALPIALFFQVAIAPEMSMIRDEFNMESTGLHAFVEGLSELTTNYWSLVLFPLLALVWSRYFSWPSRLISRRLAPRIFSQLRRWRAADLLEKLGHTSQRGRPIVGAISTLARYHYDPTLRQKLLFVRNEVEQGAELWSSLASVGVITRPEAEAITTSRPLGLEGWSLGSLAEAKRRGVLQRIAMAASLLTPALALLLGAFVLVHGLSLFLDLVSLMEGIA